MKVPPFCFSRKDFVASRGNAGRIIALTLLTAFAASLVLAQKPLLLNNYYTCNRERIVVLSCVDQSDKDYNDCIVQLPDRPLLPNGQMRATTVLRRNLVKLIQTCTMGAPVSKAGQTTGSEGWLDKIFNPILSAFRSVTVSIARIFGTFGTIAIWAFWIFVIWACAKVIRKIMGTDTKPEKQGTTASDRNEKIWRNANKDALQEFGSTPEARAAQIDEVFDKRQQTVEVSVIDRGLEMNVRMGRSLAAMTLREVEALRTCYQLFNLGMQPFNNFYIGRVGIIYGDGKAMVYGDSDYGIGNYERIMAAYKLDQSVNIALQDLMKAIQQNPNHPGLVKLKDRIMGGGGDLVPTAPLKSALNGSPIGSGLVLGLDDKSSNKIWYYDGEGSLITVAPTRSGKTAAQVYPNMLRFKGPTIVLDIKGEIYAKTSKWRKENVGPILRFSPLDPRGGHCYNPLTAVRSEPEYLWTDARVLADLMIVPSEGGGGGNSKFFEEAARDVVHAAIAVVCLQKDVTKRPMSKVLDIIHGVGWNQFIFDMQARPDMPSLARAAASFSQTLTPETRGSILQTAQRNMSAWMGDLPERATSKSDWQPSDFRNGSNPTLYICIGLSDMKSYRSLLRTIIGQHINILTSGQPPARTNPPLPPILFVLDELPQLKNMPPVEEALVVGAGYGVKLWMFIQDLGQLKKEYENADGMVSNCAVRMFMNPDLNDGTAQKLSEDIGFRESVLDGNRVKVVEPNVLAGPEYSEKVLVWARGMSRPASLRKNFAHNDAAITARMGSL